MEALWKIFLIYVVLVNIVAFCMMGIDKRRAPDINGVYRKNIVFIGNFTGKYWGKSWHAGIQT